jgi:hypothetical protein
LSLGKNWCVGKREKLHHDGTRARRDTKKDYPQMAQMGADEAASGAQAPLAVTFRLTSQSSLPDAPPEAKPTKRGRAQNTKAAQEKRLGGCRRQA